MPPFSIVAIALAVVVGTLCALADGEVRLLAVAVALGACVCIAIRSEAVWFRILVLVALGAGGLNALHAARAVPAFAEQRTARYAGTVVGCEGTETAIALDAGPTVLAGAGASAPCGTRVLVRGRLEPFDDARNPGEPSERQLQHARGYDARLAAATLLSSVPDCAHRPRAWLACAHRWAHAQFALRLGEPFASVLAGELWGERGALPPDLRREFQETGTVHVLVTAGLHFGAVALTIVALVSLLALPRAATCALAIVGVWAFVLWSGAQLPAVRAATMATVALTARAFGRAAFSWNALALAAIGVSLARPLEVASASFALSFSCVGAIFALAKPLERWVEHSIALPARVREALVLTLATQLGTWPVGAAVFLQFAPTALPANLAVVPCVAFTMGLGVLQLAFAGVPPLAQAVANANSWLLAWMVGVVRTLATLPGSTLVMTPAPAWCIGLYDVALVAAPFAIRAGALTAAIASVSIATCLVLWPPRALDQRLRVTMLDVGQADSIVVQTPRGHAFLVDGGGRLERASSSGNSIAEAIGERIVVPFLLRQGIHRLDALILSHPHGDHAGGVAPVERRLGIGAFADGGQHYGGQAYRDAINEAHAKGIALVYPRAGAVWRTDDGVELRFLGPSLPLLHNTRNDINENSIAFLLRYRTFCMLFTGDAGAAAEARFLGEGIDLRCEVLKVGHHGSAYGTTPAFLAAVRPRYALISVGRHNLFDHPAPETLDALQRAGATVYRTDENGAISVATDGDSISIWDVGNRSDSIFARR